MENKRNFKQLWGHGLESSCLLKKKVYRSILEGVHSRCKNAQNTTTIQGISGEWEIELWIDNCCDEDSCAYTSDKSLHSLSERHICYHFGTKNIALQKPNGVIFCIGQKSGSYRKCISGGIYPRRAAWVGGTCSKLTRSGLYRRLQTAPYPRKP